MSGRGFYSNGIDSSQHYLAAVGAGKVPGVSFYNVNARRTAVSTVAMEPLIEFGTSYIYPDPGGESLTIVSDNPADIGNILEVRGLDQDFREAREVVILNGTTLVNIPGTWTRVNEVNGLALAFAGTVTVAGNNTYAQAFSDIQQSSTGVFSSPVDKRIHILQVVPSILKASGGSESSVDGALSLRPFSPVAGSFRIPFEYGLKTNGTTTVQLDNRIPQGLPGMFDIEHLAQATAANTTLYVRMAVLVEDL